MPKKRTVWVCTVLLLVHGDGITQAVSGLQPIIPLTSTAYKKTEVSTLAATLLPAAADFNGQQRISIAAENRFMLSELSSFYGGWIKTTQHSALKVGAGFQGNLLQSHYGLHAGYAMQLNKQLNAGLTIGLDAKQMKGDKTAMLLTAEGGLMLFVQDRIGWGIHLKTATPVGQSTEHRTGYQEIKTGVGFQLSDAIFLAAEWGTRSAKNNNANLSVGWMLTEKIGVIAGVSNPMGNLFCSLSRKSKSATCSIGLSSHGMLGPSGILTVDYALDRQ